MTESEASAPTEPVEFMEWLTRIEAAEKSGRLAIVAAALRSREQIEAWAAEDSDDIEAWILLLGPLITQRTAGTLRSAVVEARVEREREERAAAAKEARDARERDHSARDADRAKMLGTERPEAAVLGLLQRTEPTNFKPATTKASAWNLGTILRLDSRWRGRIRTNDLRGEPELRTGDGWRSIVDVDDVDTGRWVSEVYGLEFASGIVREQLSSVANEVHFHPVVDYLRGLTWRGGDVIGEWMADALGAQRTPLMSAIGQAWLVSMVARVMSPGCKVDTVPVLIGAQGAGKSSTLKAMMPDVRWFADSEIPLRASGPDRYQVIRGIWLYEVAEIDRYSSKIDASEIKAYLTSSADTYRASYGHRPTTVPRQVVFAASTNSHEPLVDPTGARRFWPVQCGACDPGWVADHRDQLWAQAVALYDAGTSWWLSSESEAAVAEVADTYRASHPWEHTIALWLEAPERIFDKRLTISEVLHGALEMPPKDHDFASQRIVGGILKQLGWEKSSERSGRGGKTGTRYWSRPVTT